MAKKKWTEEQIQSAIAGERSRRKQGTQSVSSPLSSGSDSADSAFLENLRKVREYKAAGKNPEELNDGFYSSSSRWKKPQELDPLQKYSTNPLVPLSDADSAKLEKIRRNSAAVSYYRKRETPAADTGASDSLQGAEQAGSFLPAGTSLGIRMSDLPGPGEELNPFITAAQGNALAGTEGTGVFLDSDTSPEQIEAWKKEFEGSGYKPQTFSETHPEYAAFTAPDFTVSSENKDQVDTLIDEFYAQYGLNRDRSPRDGSDPHSDAADEARGRLLRDPEYAAIQRLENKLTMGRNPVSNFVEPFLYGVSDALNIPQYSKYAAESIARGQEEQLEKAGLAPDADLQRLYETADTLEETTQDAYRQNQFAGAAGNIAGTALEYALGSRYASAIPGIGKLTQGMNPTMANLVNDTLVDVGLDTLPRAIDDIYSGASPDEVLKNAALNVGENAVFNLGSDLLFRGIGAAGRKIRNLRNSSGNQLSPLQDSVKEPLSDALSPLETAGKNGYTGDGNHPDTGGRFYGEKQYTDEADLPIGRETDGGRNPGTAVRPESGGSVERGPVPQGRTDGPADRNDYQRSLVNLPDDTIRGQNVQNAGGRLYGEKQYTDEADLPIGRETDGGRNPGTAVRPESGATGIGGTVSPGRTDGPADRNYDQRSLVNLPDDTIRGQNVQRAAARRSQRPETGALGNRVEVSENFYIPSEGVRARLEQSGATPLHLRDTTAEPEVFSAALEKGRASNPHGLMVDGQSPEELAEAGARTFLSDDGMAGAAVMPDGNIVAVFKDSASEKKQAARELLLTALENGGDRLDCYGTQLVDTYRQSGFVPVARVEFNPAYAPEGWTFGKQDVYVMAHNGDLPEDILRKSSLSSREGGYKTWTQEELDALPTFAYDDAIAYRDRLLAERYAAEGGNASGPGISGEGMTGGAGRSGRELRSYGYDRTANPRPAETGRIPEVTSKLNNFEAAGPSSGGNGNAVFSSSGGSVPELRVSAPAASSSVPELRTARKASEPEIPAGYKERGYAESIRTQTDLPDELKNNFAAEPEIYKPLSNQETLKKAESILSEGIDRAATQFRILLDRGDPTAVPLGFRLAREYSAQGRPEDAVQILRDVSKKMTKSGQFNQAAVITLMKNEPMTALNYLERSLDDLNRAGAEKYGKKWKDFFLTEEEIQAFSQISPGDASAIQEAFEAVGKRISEEMPSTAWEKVVEASRISMLLNPRTNVRNLVGNAVMIPGRAVSDKVSALGQKAYSFLNKEYQPTQAVKVSKQSKQLADQVWDGMKDEILSGGSKYADGNSVGNSLKGILKDAAGDKVVFKKNAKSVPTKVIDKLFPGVLEKANQAMGKNAADNRTVLETLRNFTYWCLEKGDNPFVERAFKSRLGSYIEARGYKSLDEISEEAFTTAFQSAMKDTFKDDNGLTKTLSGIKNRTGKVGEAVMPFTKTPANIAMRGLEYSPAGIVRAMSSFKNTRNIGALFDDLSKAATGTGAIFAGYALASSGILRGALSSDPDKAAFEKQQGKQPFSVEIGDKSYTFDWAQPAATPFIIGAALYDSLNSGEKGTDWLSTAANTAGAAFSGAANKWLELSPLQDLADLFSSNNGDFGKNLAELPSNFIGRFVPSFFGATSRTIDNTKRQTYTSGNTWQSAVDSMKANIPGISQTLPAAVDTWGRDIQQSPDNAYRWAAQYLSPGRYSESTATEIDPVISELYEATGESAVFPQKASWKITNGGDASYSLNSREYSQYQRTMGQQSYSGAEALIHGYFEEMTDSQKSKALQIVYEGAKETAVQEILQARGVTDFSDENQDTISKVEEYYGEYTPENLARYAANKVLLGSYANEKGYAAVEEEGIDPSLYLAYKQALKELAGPGKSPTKEDTEEALRSTKGLTNTERAYLFSQQNKNWKENPFE